MPDTPSSTPPLVPAGLALADFWSRLRSQGKEAQKELYEHAERFCPPVWNRLRVRAERRQDLLHEVFLSVVSYADRHADPPRNLPAFLKGWALASLRGNRRAVEPCEPLDPPDPRHGPADSTYSQELLAAVRACADRLAGARREAFLLHYVKQLDRETAAKQAGVSVNAFALRVFQANREVRACLERKGFRP